MEEKDRVVKFFGHRWHGLQAYRVHTGAGWAEALREKEAVSNEIKLGFFVNIGIVGIAV